MTIKHILPHDTEIIFVKRGDGSIYTAGVSKDIIKMAKKGHLPGKMIGDGTTDRPWIYLETKK